VQEKDEFFILNYQTIVSILMESTTPQPWPLWRRIGFRLVFVYLVLTFSPLSFLELIPGAYAFMEILYTPFVWLTEWVNKTWLHIADPLIMPNGSGDTSYGWASMYTYLMLAVVIGLAWSVLDRNRRSYNQLNYWFCILLRYTLMLVCFAYGIQKVFALQMPFPNMSQLATPLGDFLPMRLSWMFIGYSTPYQVFSGLAEVMAALLLIWRRTATLGALVAFGVMVNVAMLNLSYDIPVKIYSIHLCIISAYLVWQERSRLLNFFVLNRPAAPSSLFQHSFPKRWMRISRIVAKVLFVLLGMGGVVMGAVSYRQQVNEESKKVLPPVKPGMYQVELFVKNGDTLRLNYADSTQWKELIFDYNGQGSVNAVDTSFRMRYRRGYFSYLPDSTGQSIAFRKFAKDSLPLFTLQLQQPDSNTMVLQGKMKKDDVIIRLRKMARHFQLTERQFHWLSEDNR
jgi:hypothetical protein